MTKNNHDSHTFLNKIWTIALRELKIPNDSDWKSFNLLLGQPDKGLLKDIRNSMNSQDKAKISGLYAFYNGKKCLYVGQSRDSSYRIYHHCRTAWKIAGTKRWQTFFFQFKNKKLIIKWYHIPDHSDKPLAELIRTISELYFTKIFKPEFIDFE